MRFFQDFWPPPNFHEVLCKDRSNINLIDFPVRTAVKAKPMSDTVLPHCSLWFYAVPTPAPPGTPAACSALGFQDTFAVSRLRGENPARSHGRGWWCLVTNAVWVRGQVFKT